LAYPGKWKVLNNGYAGTANCHGSKNKNPKLLLVTDRVDLDDQITETFKKCGKQVKQANTGKHLLELLKDKDDGIITTIINKFEAAIKIAEPFTSNNIFVLVDEGTAASTTTLMFICNGCFQMLVLLLLPALL